MRESEEDAKIQATVGPALCQRRTSSYSVGYVTPMNLKKKAVLDRIRNLEDAIAKGHEYLESGKHADWHGFRPLFAAKVRDGKTLPPHKDWIRNVFLRRNERALRRAEDTLNKLT